MSQGRPASHHTGLWISLRRPRLGDSRGGISLKTAGLAPSGGFLAVGLQAERPILLALGLGKKMGVGKGFPPSPGKDLRFPGSLVE